MISANSHSHRSSAVSLTKVLLICGIVSSMLFVTMDIVTSYLWAGYSFFDQAFSELTAIEAPTRPYMIVALSVPYNILVIAFAVGIWESKRGQSRAFRIIAVLLLIHAVVGFIGSVFFPMHSRGMEKVLTFTDTMHIICTSIEVLSMLLAIGFGVMAFGNWFRIYSIVTINLLVLGGILAAFQADRLAAGLPTPWMGITERVNIYSFMCWVIVLAIILFRDDKVARRKHWPLFPRTNYLFNDEKQNA